MRYKRTKIVSTTLYDGEIHSLSDIRQILERLCNQEIDIKLKMHDGTFLNKVRVKLVDDDGFKYQIMGQIGSLIKRGTFDEIDVMEVATNNQFMLENKPGMSRWNLLNPDEKYADEVGKQV